MSVLAYVLAPSAASGGRIAAGDRPTTQGVSALADSPRTKKPPFLIPETGAIPKGQIQPKSPAPTGKGI